MCITILIRKITILVVLISPLFRFTNAISYNCDRRSSCGCSKRSIVIMSKIVGGEPVTLAHSWGWIGSLRVNGIHRCGASLISPKYAITAAHCIQSAPLLSNVSLNFDISNLSNIGQLRYVIEKHVHPLFDPNSFANDLAILRLHKPIELNNSNVSIICLPNPGEFDLEKAEYPPVGEHLIAIGWGTTNSSTRKSTQILQQVTIQAISQSDPACLQTINDETVQFCAGLPEGGKDTCQGDSGGPLMLFKDRRWQLIGITSYGPVCAVPGFAGVYTRVAHFESFIRKIIQSDKVPTSNFKIIDAKRAPNRSSYLFYRQLTIFLYLVFLFTLYIEVFY